MKVFFQPNLSFVSRWRSAISQCTASAWPHCSSRRRPAALVEASDFSPAWLASSAGSRAPTILQPDPFTELGHASCQRALAHPWTGQLAGDDSHLAIPGTGAGSPDRPSFGASFSR